MSNCEGILVFLVFIILIISFICFIGIIIGLIENYKQKEIDFEPHRKSINFSSNLISCIKEVVKNAPSYKGDRF